jgi:hypothetical protein
MVALPPLVIQLYAETLEQPFVSILYCITFAMWFFYFIALDCPSKEHEKHT